jgi:hypothetical protein
MDWVHIIQKCIYELFVAEVKRNAYLYIIETCNALFAAKCYYGGGDAKKY